MVRIVQKLRPFLFVVAILVGMSAHAATTAIQSVIAYGKTEQNGTPTPTNPVPIMTNNGAIKIFAGNKWTDVNKLSGYIMQYNTGEIRQNSNYNVSAPIFLKAGVYSVSYYTPDTGSKPFTIWESNAQGDLVGDGRVFTIARPDVGTNTGTFTIDRDMYVRVSWRVDFTDIVVAPTSAIIYTDGMVETIRDAAGHKATTQMLLGLNDEYRDEQNITTGAITRKVGVKVLDGSESWELYNWGAQNVRDVMRVTLSSIAPDAKNNLSTAEQLAVVKCTHLVQRGVSAFNGDVSGFAWATKWFDTTPRVAIRVAGITTVAQFKSWLAEQYAAGTPVIVLYPLATETPEDGVAPHRLTTAPVRQTLGAIMDMPIKTILTDNTEIMSGANELIKIATTKYNEESFEDVQDALTGVFNAVDTVVTQTMTQAQQIDQIATNKQTRPNADCPVGKNCLLVEDEQGVPHWYVIAGADEANPTNP